MLKLNVNNETSRLLTVVLGTAKSNGSTPKLEECYDPKSRQNVLNNTYPTEIDMINEMNQFEQVLLKYKVDIRRPETIINYNQIFSRDIAFVVDDSFIISNILPDRSNEILAINKVIDLIPKNKIIELPEDCHVEGGDVEQTVAIDEDPLLSSTSLTTLTVYGQSAGTILFNALCARFP